jgi:hypothetical protein
VAQGDAELEQWLWGREAPKGTSASGTGWIWFGPVYGMTRDLELAMPWEIVTGSAGTRLSDFAFEARYKIWPEDPGEHAGLGLRARLYYQSNFDHPFNGGRFGVPWLGADLIASWGRPGGSHATLDVGGYMDAFGSRPLMHGTGDLGYTYQVSKEWRVGAEAYADLSLGSLLPDNDHFWAGPVVAFSRAQVWVTAGVLVGLDSTAPASIPRLMVGVSL